MAPIVEISDLWWRYSPETDWVLRGVELSINPGETMVVTGPTGAGKTTLLSFMQALLPHSFPLGEMKGSVRVDGVDVKSTRASKLLGKVGMVFEDAEAQFVFPTVEDDLALALENLELPEEEVKKRLSKIMSDFGLQELMGRTAGELSGGEKQRVSIAGLMAVRPKILLLDEPTSELDPISKREVLSMIRKIRSESDMTLVIVEQDLEEVATFAEKVVLVDEGRIQRLSSPREFFSDPSVLMGHGVYPPEVCIIFHPLLKLGAIGKIPLSVEEALVTVRGK